MAKKFKFSLQPVLRYREIIESQKKKDFAVANRAVEEERLRREEMAADRALTQDEVRTAYAGGEPFGRVVEAYRYLNAVDLQLLRNARKLTQLGQVREEKRRLLVEAQKNRKALDLLKDQRKTEHNRETARDEQNALDALGVQAKRRRDREESEHG